TCGIRGLVFRFPSVIRPPPHPFGLSRERVRPARLPTEPLLNLVRSMHGPVISSNLLARIRKPMAVPTAPGMTPVVELRYLTMAASNRTTKPHSAAPKRAWRPDQRDALAPGKRLAMVDRRQPHHLMAHVHREPFTVRPKQGKSLPRPEPAATMPVLRHDPVTGLDRALAVPARPAP